MSKSPEQVLFEQEVYRIADTLLASLQQDEDGSYWQRKRVTENGSISPLPETTDIFNGSTGTLLFLMELYRYQPDSRYIDCCNKVLDRLLRKTYATAPAYYTFYTGATGLIYACIRMYEVTGLYRYIEEGIQLAFHLKKGFIIGVVKDDLLSGHAGNVLVVSYLYAHSGDPVLLPIIKEICDMLISHARIADTGLKWDNEKFAYDSLTGFSHGAAGIAYALLETGRYFGDETLCWLGEQALAYEMQYYDAEKNNWMDLRVNSLKIPPEESLYWDLQSFKSRMSDACSWAHGATGATLARLHAYRITGDIRYVEQAHLGIRRTIQDISAPSRYNYTLCSGYGGHIMLLLKASQVLDDGLLYAQAVRYAQDALYFFQEHGTYTTYSAATPDDPALLSGLAGMGYLYLQFLLPYDGNTVLYPQIPGHATDHRHVTFYNIAAVKADILGAHFKQTLSLLQPATLCWKSIPDIQALEHYLSKQNSDDARDNLWETFSFERTITALWKMHKGMLCYRKKAQRLQSISRNILQHDDDTLLNIELVLCSHVKIHSGQAGYKVMYCQEQGVSILSVNHLPGLILSYLERVRTTKDVVVTVTDRHFPDQPATIQQQISRTILEQVRLLLQHGLITTAQ